MTALLEASRLDVRIGRQRVCRRLDLRIEAGQSWALMGRNGTGKTTLLHHLAGLRRSHEGAIRIAGEDLTGMAPRRRAQRIAVLLQHSSRGFGGSVLESVLTGRHPHLPRLAWEGAEDLAVARHCLAALGLDALAQRYLDTLSGGELRRVEIARLLAQQARLALLDEPMNHLDLAHQAASLRVLREHCVSPRRALLMVVHDLNLAYRACDHWLILDGSGGWQAGAREQLGRPELLSRVFGHPIDRIAGDQGPLFFARL